MSTILEIREVATIFKLPIRSVSALAKRGELQGFKVSNRWRFRAEDVEEFIERKINESQTRHIVKAT